MQRSTKYLPFEMQSAAAAFDSVRYGRGISVEEDDGGVGTEMLSLTWALVSVFRPKSPQNVYSMPKVPSPRDSSKSNGQK